MAAPIVERARLFATAAHAAVAQVRKYTGEPYIHHPTEVAGIVESVGGTDEMIAAAFLHDVVEDTGVSLDLIRVEFGDEVAQLVCWLTDVSKPEDGPRAVRKGIDRAHTALATPQAKTIKLADLIANTRSIMVHDKNFAQVYVKEKAALLEVLTEGNQELYRRAQAYIDAWNNRTELPAD